MPANWLCRHVYFTGMNITSSKYNISWNIILRFNFFFFFYRRLVKHFEEQTDLLRFKVSDQHKIAHFVKWEENAR